MAKKQNYEKKDAKIRQAFEELKAKHPERFKKRLNLSWSNWGFGMEKLEESVSRLHKAGIEYIELHGNHYGDDLGYKVNETKKILESYNIKVSGTCGMFSNSNDLSSANGIQQQAAIDYIRREIEFTSSLGGSYLLIVPASCGRPEPYDDTEFERSANALRLVADLFLEHNVKAAIEPFRSAETSIVHTINDAKRYIDEVNHPGVKHINGDLYHMQTEESHIGEAIIDAGDMLVNLHMADSNRRALGHGSLNLDIVIMALYIIGYNSEGRFVTPEPLGPGGAPYPAMHAKPDKAMLDELVMQTTKYFREREEVLLA
ncbi:MAG: sugar phosphate isomerase/epimerase [Clostridiaceae bacterium]|nr:sugar phosphate isomerase/epimerase [Clostridiaceae bacterium]